MTISSSRTTCLASESDFSGWRAWSRVFLHKNVPGSEIVWAIREPASLYGKLLERVLPQAPTSLNVSRAMASLMTAVFASGAPDRFALLYQLLERLHAQQNDPRNDQNNNKDPLPAPLLERLEDLACYARQTALDVRASLPPPMESAPVVRRLEVPVSLLDSQAQALWKMRPQPWLIRTPGRILFCEKGEVRFAPDLIPPAPLYRETPQSETPREEPSFSDQALWEHARETGRSAQENVYWRGVAPLRVTPDAVAISATPTLHGLRALAVDCALCPLSCAAERTVFGEGNPDARLLFVGEQPGDYEDRTGRPFVGPAGQLFDKALAEAGGDRREAWVTNAVKHFRFIQTPARRLHQKPDLSHIHACAPWLDAERKSLTPEVTVLLGVTGASAVLGRPVTISRERSKLFPLETGGLGLVTVHPSYLLRLPDPAKREEEFRKFVADLKTALSALAPNGKEE